mmetsp:Transcript_3244/g.6293  ORF Transcript_3244/g.6293 Transcript_3244/m.6293 type:complete len:333 (-) Transcript_3244:2983-3981(-)
MYRQAQAPASPGGEFEEEVYEEEEDEEEEEYGDASWIVANVEKEGNEFLGEIPEAYIEDNFNLHGLSAEVSNYSMALRMILDSDLPENVLEDQRMYQRLERSAEELYGLIHARWILTEEGMQEMKEKYTACQFGLCPRQVCKRHPVLPVGEVDAHREQCVKVFCPRCKEVYDVWITEAPASYPTSLDGAFFGTSFPHLFLMRFPEFKFKEKAEHFVPRVYGFKVADRPPKKYIDSKKRAVEAGTVESRKLSATAAGVGVASSTVVQIGQRGAARASQAREDVHPVKDAVSSSSAANKGASDAMQITQVEGKVVSHVATDDKEKDSAKEGDGK